MSCRKGKFPIDTQLHTFFVLALMENRVIKDPASQLYGNPLIFFETTPKISYKIQCDYIRKQGCVFLDLTRLS